MFRASSLVGLLGIVLTFSPEALYSFYEDQPQYWGMSALTTRTSAAPSWRSSSRS